MGNGRQDPFGLLGVDPGTPAEAVAKAYRRLAQTYHPDRYGDAPNDVRLDAERRMAQINAARDAIRAGYRRPAGPRLTDADDVGDRPPGATKSYYGIHCTICGHVPAAEVTFKACLGLRRFRHARTWHGHLCRDCGESVYREIQNQTLIKGWWGVTSFIANVFAVVGNWSQKRYLGKLGHPKPTPAVARTPRSVPLPSGRPLRQRLGPWMALGVLTVAALAVGAGTSFTSASNADAMSVHACTSWDLLKLDTAQHVATSAEFDATFYQLGGAADAEVRQAGGAYLTARRLNDAAALGTARSGLDAACLRAGRS